MSLNPLSKLCRQLQLSGISTTVDQACEAAVRQQQSPHDFLLDLFQQESEWRNQRRAHRRIKEAKFPGIKTLESFDFERAQHLPEVLLRELAQGQYISEAQPIILIGELGTGKTHLACALGYATTFCDLARHNIFDVVPGKSSADLAGYLNSLSGKERVKVVCIDLSTSYRNIVRQHFPNAMIVADRFHVIRLVNQMAMQTYQSIDPRQLKNRPGVKARSVF